MAGLDDYAGIAADAASGRRDLVIVAQSYGTFTANLAASQLPSRLLVLLAGMIRVPGETPAQWRSNTAASRLQRSRPGWTAARPATTTRSSASTTEYAPAGRGGSAKGAAAVNPR
jgi:hypothetical protein